MLGYGHSFNPHLLVGLTNPVEGEDPGILGDAGVRLGARRASPSGTLASVIVTVM